MDGLVTADSVALPRAVRRRRQRRAGAVRMRLSSWSRTVSGSGFTPSSACSRSFRVSNSFDRLRALAALEMHPASARGWPLRAADRARSAAAPRAPSRSPPASAGSSSFVSASSCRRRSRCRSAPSHSSKAGIANADAVEQVARRRALHACSSASGAPVRAPAARLPHRIDESRAGSSRTIGRSATRHRAATSSRHCRSGVSACFRLSRACGSPRSLHSRPASLSRDWEAPCARARIASKARSFWPGRSAAWPLDSLNSKAPSSLSSATAIWPPSPRPRWPRLDNRLI